MENETTDAYDCLCWSSAGDAEASLLLESAMVKANDDMHKSPVTNLETEVQGILNVHSLI